MVVGRTCVIGQKVKVKFNSTKVHNYNVQVINHNHKIKVDIIFARARFAKNLLRSAVLVYFLFPVTAH